MKKSHIYLVISIVCIPLTFMAIGGIMSLILFFVIKSEKTKLSNRYLVGYESELNNLQIAKIFTIINLLINGIILAYIVFMVSVTLITSPPGTNHWQ